MRLRLLCILALLAFTATTALAQRGKISGIVTDADSLLFGTVSFLDDKRSAPIDNRNGNSDLEYSYQPVIQVLG